ncbi:histidine kinase, dimerisation and phosphoacceptor region (plasmid) [Nocardioides sp. JS614]|nr:histidine kinase, dimerisation and phosphoacceptor region [Nocardioides sp. JS614]
MTVRRLPRDHPRVVDLVIAGGCLLILTVALLTDDGYLSGPRWAYLTTSCLMTTPLAWRRNAPLTSLTIVMTGLAVQELLVDPAPTMDDALIPLLISAFSVAAYGTRTTAGLGLGISLGAGAIWVGIDDIFFPVVAFSGAWLAGRLVHHLQQQSLMARNYAEALERERAATTRAALAEERTRIARELHDVVSHTLGVMVVQAGGERLHAAPGSGAHTALASIEESGRLAMEQMRRLLSMLREEADTRSLVPQPGLTQLDELTESVRATGLDVSLLVTGDPHPIGPDLDVSAFRIVQEALTNTVRHSGATRAEIHLDWASNSLRIEVSDNGRGPSPTPTPEGHGLLGMRERVNLFGGVLSTGRSNLGGYRLMAQLPTPTP